MPSASASKKVNLIGAIFCFGAFLLFILGYFASTATQLGFYPADRSIVYVILWFGSAFLIALGLMFHRDYYRS
jgi:hypothetical protein